MIGKSVRLAGRRLLRQPGLAFVTFLTLTIGIAVSATIFTVTWNILMRPFVFANQEGLVALWANDPVGTIERFELSYEEVQALRKESQTLEDIAAHCAANFPLVARRGKGDPMHLQGCSVGEPFFRTLGIRPLLGRTFSPEEHKAGAEVAVMLSYDAWQNRFGGDAKIVGDTIGSSGVVANVVGILPRHLTLPNGADIIFPLEPGLDQGADTANRVLTAVARIRDGRTIDDVNRELAVIVKHVPRTHADEKRVLLLAHPLVSEILGGTKHALHILLWMGALVLVIAILNIAAISVAQGIGRSDELAIRSSLGATRGRTAMELFFEFALIGGFAAAAACVLTATLITLLIKLAPPSVPRIAEVAFGWQTVAFAAGAVIVAAIVASAMQLLPASDDALLATVRAASRSATGRTSRRVLEILAACQVAVAVVTVIVAFMLVESFRRFASIDVGFARENVVTFHLPRGYVMAPEPAKHHAFFAATLGRIRSLPGVVAAGSVLMRPLEMEQGWDFAHTIEGQDAAQHAQNPLANFLAATPGYFEAMRMQLLAGRFFTDADRADTQPVAVISESFAKRYWKTPAEAIGKRVKSGPPDSAKPWMTVAGVVRDVRYRALTIEKIDIYAPHLQSRWSPNYFAVRTSGAPEQIVPAIRSIVAELDPDVPVAAVKTTHDLVDAKLAQPRLSAAVVTLFALTAALLALVGLYGVLSYNVRQRSGEIGVRAALGATDRRLAAMIAREALAITLAGTCLGLLLGIASERIWRGFVYGIEGIPPAAMIAVAICAAIAGVIASALPALRAMRTDPVAALRLE